MITRSTADVLRTIARGGTTFFVACVGAAAGAITGASSGMMQDPIATELALTGGFMGGSLFTIIGNAISEKLYGRKQSDDFVPVPPPGRAAQDASSRV